MSAPAGTVIPTLTGSPWLPAALSLIAGLTDVTSWLTLGGLFAAHITGNLVVISADLIRGVSAGTSQLLAVPMFVLVAALGYGADRMLGRCRGRASSLLALQAIFLLAASWIAVHGEVPPHPGQHGDLRIAMLAVAAMAMQNTVLHLVAGPVPTTAVMTGNLVSATLALAAKVFGPEADRPAASTRWNATWPLLIGFLGGCALGAAAVVSFSERAWLLPAAVSIALCLWQARHDFSLATPVRAPA